VTADAAVTLDEVKTATLLIVPVVVLIVDDVVA
jgi:hypothetical protein